MWIGRNLIGRGLAANAAPSGMARLSSLWSKFWTAWKIQLGRIASEQPSSGSSEGLRAEKKIGEYKVGGKRGSFWEGKCLPWWMLPYSVRDIGTGREPGSHRLLAEDTRCTIARNLLNIKERAFTQQWKSNILIESFWCSSEKGFVIWLAKTICSFLLFTAKESNRRRLQCERRATAAVLPALILVLVPGCQQCLKPLTDCFWQLHGYHVLPACKQKLWRSLRGCKWPAVNIITSVGQNRQCIPIFSPP